MAQGQCLCGAVRFELQPPWRWFAHCHCSTCRRHQGSLFSTSLGVHVERFRWTAGAGRAVDYAASPAFRRPFCRRCGSKLPAAPQREDTVNVPAGLVTGLDGRPRTHIFTASRAACDVIADDLPQFEAYPAGAVPEATLPARQEPRQGLPSDSLPERPREFPAPPEGTIAGGCGCGAVAYEVAGSLETLIHNHSPAARRSRGAAYATDAVVAAERVRWRRGTERITTVSLDVPGAPAPDMPFRVSFCRGCGGLLPVRLGTESAAAADRGGAPGTAGETAREGAPDAAGRILIPAGSVVSRLEAPRTVHVFVATRAAWFDIADSLPQYPFLPPPELT